MAALEKQAPAKLHDLFESLYLAVTFSRKEQAKKSTQEAFRLIEEAIDRSGVPSPDEGEALPEVAAPQKSVEELAAEIAAVGKSEGSEKGATKKQKPPKTKKGKGKAKAKTVSKPPLKTPQQLAGELNKLKAAWVAKRLDQTAIDQICTIRNRPITEENIMEADLEDIAQRLSAAYGEQMTPTLGDRQGFFGAQVANFPAAGVSATGYPIHISIYPDAFSQPKSMADYDNDHILGQLLASGTDMSRLHASLEYPNAFAPQKPRLYYGEKGARAANYPPPANEATKKTVRRELDNALGTYVEGLRGMIQRARDRGGLIP